MLKKRKGKTVNTGKINGAISFKCIPNRVVYDEARQLHANGIAPKKMAKFYNNIAQAQQIQDYNIDRIISADNNGISVIYGVSDRERNTKGKFSTLNEAMEYGITLQKATSQKTPEREKQKLFKKLVGMACKYNNDRTREKYEDLLKKEIFFSAMA